mgnify:CR=1 FL=1
MAGRGTFVAFPIRRSVREKRPGLPGINAAEAGFRPEATTKNRHGKRPSRAGTGENQRAIAFDAIWHAHD